MIELFEELHHFHGFPYQPDYTTQSMVLPDGTISVMLLGQVQAAGKTSAQLRHELSAGYKALDAANDFSDPEKIKIKKYFIQPQDILEIKFSTHPELDDTVTVRPDGRISLRWINTVVAEGKTPEQLNEQLQNSYSDHLGDPELVIILRKSFNNPFHINGTKKWPFLRQLDEVYVNVRSYAQLQIYVGGEVKKSGFYDYRHPLTTLQAIIAAGGATDRAELRTVAVIRKDLKGKGTIFIRDLKTGFRPEKPDRFDRRLRTTASNDLVLRPYDIVIVPMSRIASIGIFVEQHLYSLIPNLRDIVNFNFVYDLNHIDLGY